MADMVASPAGATDQEKAILNEIAGIQAKTNPLAAEIIALQEKGDGEAARKILLEQARPAFVQWLGAINKFIDYQEALNKTIGGKVRSSASGFKPIVLTALGIAALLSIVAAVITSRTIVGPLAKLQLSLKAMAEGNLDGDRRLEARGDEIGKLALTISRNARYAENLASTERQRNVVQRRAGAAGRDVVEDEEGRAGGG